MQSSSALDARSGKIVAGLENISLITVIILPPQLIEWFCKLCETKHLKLSMKPVIKNIIHYFFANELHTYDVIYCFD